MPKSTADWSHIKRLWEEGKSAPAIESGLAKTAEGKPLVSRQAILKRARKEKWLQGVSRPPGTNVEPIGTDKAIAQWVPALVDQLKAAGKHLAEAGRLERALNSYALGGNHNMAAAMAGMDRVTWERWRSETPSLEAAIAQLQATNAAKHLKKIDEAGERGDWKANQALLQANSLTKADWKPQDQEGGGKTAVNIQIVLGVPRAPDPKVIDG